MLPQEQMRMGAQILAAIFGGPGVFYVWRSFDNPDDGLRAAFHLVVASLLALYSGAPIRMDLGTLARCRALLARKRRS